jgi:MerR family transcriptional regulator, mercuric resistance operon regulatory protein
MLIGEVATKAGVNVQTIRFYERRAILKKPHRLSSGYRNYPEEVVEIVQFIKRSQEHGFTLKEISKLLKSLATGSLTGAEVYAAFEKKIQSLDDRIQKLQTMRDELRAGIASCGCGNGSELCPNLKAIAKTVRRV